MQEALIELARIKTSDSLELHGLLFRPCKKSNTALIHVHGWTGNFYENAFIEFIASEAVNHGLAFLSFNTRGAGHVQEFLKEKNGKREFVKIGGSLEKFTDCTKDIGGAIKFLRSKGFNRIILEGHSTGCQKIAFYLHKTKDKSVKGLVFLEPTDDPSITERFLGKRYREALGIAKKMVKSRKGKEPMPAWVPFGVMLSAEKFMSMSDPEYIEGRLFRFSGKLAEIRAINCPALAVFGANTEYQEKPGEKLEILKRTMTDCDTKLIQNTNHWFKGKEKELAKTIVKWIRQG
ncbi:MAG: alpha/beta fold hydrolase [Candidatus Diapherotrites archaeon]|nr:alpha/beta fold hydrolase [Candidatus Diapherotrites archaeon]